jgi:hypothetical protein
VERLLLSCAITLCLQVQGLHMWEVSSLHLSSSWPLTSDQVWRFTQDGHVLLTLATDSSLWSSLLLFPLYPSFRLSVCIFMSWRLKAVIKNFFVL